MDSVAAKRSFGWGNLALIISLALILTFFAFRQKAAQTLQASSSNQVNYVLSPQFAENISGSTDPSNVTVLALAGSSPDAAANTAKVLGAATYNKDFVNQLNVSVQTIQDNSGTAAQNYAQEVSVLFNADKVAVGAANQEQKFLNDIKQLAVPQNISDYQKLLIGYYALTYMKDLGQGDANIDQYISQIKVQFDQARDTFNQAYNINLP